MFQDKYFNLLRSKRLNLFSYKFLGSSYVFQYRNQVRDICAMDLFLQVGLQNTRDNVLLKLISQIINEPCFNILRTK